METINNIYDYIKLGNYKKLIKQYDESEQIFKDSLNKFPNNIISYINLGELYFEIGEKNLSNEYFIIVMHLLIQNKLLKSYGKLHYDKLEKLRDEKFFSSLDSNQKNILPIKESFLIYKEENISYRIGENLLGKFSSKQQKLNIGREYLLKRINWNKIKYPNVDKIYLEREKY